MFFPRPPFLAEGLTPRVPAMVLFRIHQQTTELSTANTLLLPRKPGSLVSRPEEVDRFHASLYRPHVFLLFQHGHRCARRIEEGVTVVPPRRHRERNTLGESKLLLLAAVGYTRGGSTGFMRVITGSGRPVHSTMTMCFAFFRPPIVEDFKLQGCPSSPLKYVTTSSTYFYPRSLQQSKLFNTYAFSSCKRRLFCLVNSAKSSR